MRRKITKRGYCSSSINLPRRWVLKNDLSFGDEVFLVEKGAELVVSCVFKNRVKVVDFNVLKVWKHHFFSQIYQAGFDEVIFKNFSDKDCEKIGESLWNYPRSFVCERFEGFLRVKIEDVDSNFFWNIKEGIGFCLKICDKICSFDYEERVLDEVVFFKNQIYKFSELATRQMNLQVHSLSFSYLNLVTYNLTQIGLLFEICLKFLVKNKVCFKDLSLIVRENFFLALRGLKFSFKVFNSKKFDFEEYLILRDKLHYDFLKNFKVFDGLNNNFDFFFLSKLILIFSFINGICSRGVLFLEANDLF